MRGTTYNSSAVQAKVIRIFREEGLKKIGKTCELNFEVLGFVPIFALPFLGVACT
jgi:hypothetical protein